MRQLASGYWRRHCVAFLVVAAGPWAMAANAFETTAKQAILVDFETGTVLFEKAADMPIAPASMTKMMTLYLLFQRLSSGGLLLDDSMLVSDKAWRMGGSKMFVEVDKRVRVEDLIRGIAVQSGNDAAVVVAEGIAGSETHFAQEMTATAHELGMGNTTFTNSTGWPDPEHASTARDLAVLAARTVADFADYYGYYKEKSFTYNVDTDGNPIRQGNRNPLLYLDLGADGLKTGFTEESGFGLAASAIRDERRLVLVLSGMQDAKERSREAQRFLDWGFREFANYPLFKAAESVVNAEVWLGRSATVPLILQHDLTITIPRRARRDMRVAVVYEGPIPAPIEPGANLAQLVVTAPGVETIRRPLLAGAAVARLEFTKRIQAAVGFLIWGAAGR